MNDARRDSAGSAKRVALVRALAVSISLTAASAGCGSPDPAVRSETAVETWAPVASSEPGPVIPPSYDPRPVIPLALAPRNPIPVQKSVSGLTATTAPPLVATTSPAPSYLPLDALLRLAPEPRPAEQSVDLRSPPPAAAPAPAPPGALDRLKRQMRLERRSEPIGPAGPRQGTHSEIEAVLRVPLDEDVSLEGGVRVDQRDEPGAEAPERRSTPRVGVEVRF